MPREGSHALGTSSASSRILSQVRPFVLSSQVDLTVYGCVTSLDPDTLQTPLSGHAVTDDSRSSPVNALISFASPRAQTCLCARMPPPWTRLCPLGGPAGPSENLQLSRADTGEALGEHLLGLLLHQGRLSSRITPGPHLRSFARKNETSGAN